MAIAWKISPFSIGNTNFIHGGISMSNRKMKGKKSPPKRGTMSKGNDSSSNRGFLRGYVSFSKEQMERNRSDAI